MSVPHRSCSSCSLHALTNLGDVYSELGSGYHSAALKAYVEAVSLDDKNVVLWHRIGALACQDASHLQLARVALEQGLKCRPKHCEYASCQKSQGTVLGVCVPKELIPASHPGIHHVALWWL